MAKKTTKEAIVETCEVIETPTDSAYAKLLEIYKTKNPKKYEIKKEELLKRLELNK
jgi:hypothetical protein